MNKKLLVGGLSLAVIGLGSLAFISKPTYQEVGMNNLNTEKVALYIKNDTGNYEKTNTIPTSGYILNEERSRCNNNAKPSWNKATNSLKIKDLSNDNTSCYLYFDKLTGIDAVIANAKTESPDFSQVATTDEGVYAVEDGMYSGTSYYWRGAVTNNYVKFANFCWRIIRINGDGSIRLIYDGATCHDNGTNTTESIAIENQTYSKDGLKNRSEYVGYTYVEEKQRPEAGDTIIESNLKTQTDSWYSSNIGNNDIYDSKVAQGKFCNDREVVSGSTWASQPSSILNYITSERLVTTKTPTLSCSNSGDIYNLKVGAITADEVVFAGGVYRASNTGYYLYNGQFYWTMSPISYNGISAYLFSISMNALAGPLVENNTIGIRPVINLNNDVTFSSGNGTLDNPYVVEGA